MDNKFHKLFLGLERAYGVYKLDGTITDKKVGGDAYTAAKPVTDALWKLHLDGKQGLGIVPINDKDMCPAFAVLDIDIYPLDLEALSVKIDRLGLPLIVCRTKSGGAHLYLFLKEPAPAALVRERLVDCSIVLGFTGCEIFPKQANLASEADTGNWINMPYFDAENTTRYAIKNEVSLTPKQFLSYAEKQKISLAQLEQLKPEIDPLLDGAPPCLVHLALNGVPEGGRNTALYNYGVLCKKKFVNSWKERMSYCNVTFMSRPLADKEVLVLQKSLSKKDYFYTCKQFPINDCCNKEVCRTREHGVGGSAQVDIEIGSLIKILTDPPTWIITVAGVRMEMTTDDLIKQPRFRKICVDKLNLLPQLVKGPVWEEWVRDGLNNCTIVDAPDDAGPIGMFRHYLRQFITGPSRTEDKDTILIGRVFIENDKAYFRAADLMLFLDQKRFKAYDMRKAWSFVEAHGGGHSTLRLKGVQTQVWNIPDMEMIDSDLDLPNMPEVV